MIYPDIEEIQGSVKPMSKTILDTIADYARERPLIGDLQKNITRPYFLAGGLSCENAKKAVGLLKPYAVDISSGVEEKGFKSYDKMKKFIEICRKNGG